MKVAVVILNWNGKSFLEQFLPVVIQHTTHPDIGIYVADNGSTDDSVSYLNRFTKVKTIVFDRNFGFAEGYNRALQQIEAEYYVLLNSDVEVTPDWVFPIIECLDNDNSIGAVMPKIKSYKDRNKFEYAGAAGGFIDQYGYPFCRGRILNQIEEDKGQYDEQTDVFWATGACMFVRAKAYWKVEGLDNDFFAHMEEIDLCWRLKNIGYRIMSIPQVTVYHVGGGTLPNNNPKKLYYNYRNNLLLLYKNLPPKKMLLIILMRLHFDVFSAFLYLLQFQFPFIAAVIKAHFAFFGFIPAFRKKRRRMLELRKNLEHNEMYYHSMLFDFFIRRKRTFSALHFKKN